MENPPRRAHFKFCWNDYPALFPNEITEFVSFRGLCLRKKTVPPARFLLAITAWKSVVDLWNDVQGLRLSQSKCFVASLVWFPALSWSEEGVGLILSAAGALSLSLPHTHTHRQTERHTHIDPRSNAGIGSHTYPHTVTHIHTRGRCWIYSLLPLYLCVLVC